MARGFRAGHVSAARLLCPGVRNVTLAARSLVGAELVDGADVAIRLPGDSGIEERQYSVWKTDADAGTLDVCVVLHGLGPGSRWAERCAPGDAIEFSCSLAPAIALDRSAGAHLLLGDETSVASAEALIRPLPVDAVLLACFEIPSADQRWPAAELLRPEHVHWVDRAGRPGSALLSWLARQPLPLEACTTAYVTGEAWLCAVVSAHLLRERGLSAGAVRAMPYWKRRQV